MQPAWKAFMARRATEMKTVSLLAAKAIALILLLSVNPFTSPVVLANSNFVSNPYLPYPPSCAKMPLSSATARSDTGAIQFHESTITLPDQRTSEQVDFVLRAYRSPCSEPGRSLLWLEFALSEADSRRDLQVMLPVVAADYEFGADTWTSVLAPVSDPNSWGSGSAVDRERVMLVTQPHGDPDGNDGNPADNEALSWWFLLDNESALIDGGNNVSSLMPATVYNEHFTLRLRYPPNQHIVQLEVPSTAEMGLAASDHFPITGRLSGNWVIEGANDQGVILAISGWARKNPEPFAGGFPPLRMVLFYSHHTFDAQGKMLWLTGAAQFDPGTHQVTIPIDELSQGEFRSDRPAQRRTIGQVTLTANSCNDITLDYDFSTLGLGSGTKRLQRLFSLEIAGYDCRDYAARVEANR